MKSVLYRAAALFFITCAPIYISSCSNSSTEDSAFDTSDGVSASEFASGAAVFQMQGAQALTVRALEVGTSVSPDATLAKGVSGVLEVGDTVVPVVFSYETQGTSAGDVVSAKVGISLQGVEYVQSTDLLAVLGAPQDGAFLSAEITINFLSSTMNIESVVLQPITLDPDGLLAGIIISGVEQTQTSFVTNARFFYGVSNL